MPSSQEKERVACLARMLLKQVADGVGGAGLRGLGMDLVDVSRLRGEKGRSLAAGFLSDREWVVCHALPDPSQGWGMLWAARESAYKATSGFMERYPLLWRFAPLQDGWWEAGPSKKDEGWEAFDRKYRTRVKTVSSETHALAVTVVTLRRADSLSDMDQEREP
jgi:phosphopantetheinyl transferase (holo-ACP synthase)